MGHDTEFTLIKHAYAVVIGNRMTLVQRQIWNILLLRAYPYLPTRDTFRIPVAALRGEMRYRTKNLRWLEDVFKSLNVLQIEWNILSNGRRDWGVTTALARAQIIDDHLCEYEYSKKLRQDLYDPKIYARISIERQALFQRANAMALWEFFLLQLKLAHATETITQLELPDLRKICALEPDQYRQYRDLNRRVIKPAIQEINAFGGITVDLTPKRGGRGKLLGFDCHLVNHTPEDEADPVLKTRLTQGFGLSADETNRFLAKFADQEYLTTLLNEIEERYLSNQIKHKKLTGYTRAVLERASPNPPSLATVRDARQSEREAAKQAQEVAGSRGAAEQLARLREAYDALDAKSRHEMYRKWANQSMLFRTMRDRIKAHGLDDEVVMQSFLMSVESDLLASACPA